MTPMAAPRPPAPRPIQPTIRKQLAQFLSLLDPRCETDSHNRISQGDRCQDCQRSLWEYMPAVPEVWP